MWFMILALVSIGTSLVLGRLLARVRVEQTTNPFCVRGPSLHVPFPTNREAVAENARQRRLFGAQVHLN